MFTDSVGSESGMALIPRCLPRSKVRNCTRWNSHGKRVLSMAGASAHTLTITGPASTYGRQSWPLMLKAIFPQQPRPETWISLTISETNTTRSLPPALSPGFHQIRLWKFSNGLPVFRNRRLQSRSHRHGAKNLPRSPASTLLSPGKPMNGRPSGTSSTWWMLTAVFDRAQWSSTS